MVQPANGHPPTSNDVFGQVKLANIKDGVDCALISVEHREFKLNSIVTLGINVIFLTIIMILLGDVERPRKVSVGEIVFKVGIASGITSGHVVSTSFSKIYLTVISW